MSLFLLPDRCISKIKILLTVTFFLTFSGMLYAQGNMVNLVLSVKKANYQKMEKAVQDAGGKVNFIHKYVDGMAVTVPVDKAAIIIGMPEVLRSEKDLMVSIPEPRPFQHAGYEIPASDLQVEVQNEAPLDAEGIKKLFETYPDTYYPFSNGITNTNEFYTSTGHYGEGVIVAVIDAGISKSARAVKDRIIGGYDFTGDGLGPYSASNGGHGTWVACCIGANMIAGFSSPKIQNAIKRYAPGSVLPNYFAPGIDGIPIVGQAPSVSFYALKVFPFNANSSPRSRIAAALEMAIELKEKYNSGISDGVNIQIVNMSLGGGGLTSGNDNLYAPLIKRAHDAGILMVISAGNSGPSGMTIGEPGAAPNVVTCGASDDATHERILRDYQYGPGTGSFWRPLNNNVVASYSSRGPNADGRPDPDITAPGTWRFVQSPSGTSFSWVSGTSFSAPTVAGAAALLLSARPESTPDQLRAALLRGANNTALDGNPTVNEQGFGLLDVMNAYEKLTSGVTNPPDQGLASPIAATNISVQDKLGIIHGPSFAGSTGMLAPGQRMEYYFNIPKSAKSLKISVSSVTPELPPSGQNQFFGDDVFFAIHTAEFTTEDYRGGTPLFVKAGQSYEVSLDGLDLDLGVMKIAVMGDWTNAGKVSASVSIQAEYGLDAQPFAAGFLSQGQYSAASINIPAGTAGVDFKLKWVNGWDRYPTNDLDMVVFDPDGNIAEVDNDGDLIPDGQTLSMPEYMSVSNPMPGKWTIWTLGYTIWEGRENFKVYADVHKALSKDAALLTKDMLPAEFALSQNMPNPFNPTTIVKYDLPRDAVTTLRVYNSLGQLVRTLVNELKPAGSHQVMFDGRDDSGTQLSSGMYIYQITAGSFTKSAKMLLLK